MNLEDEIIIELSTGMHSEIDFQILSDILVNLGWKKVSLNRFNNNEHAVDIKLWLEEHTCGVWQCRGSTFVFQNHGDAVNFTLKWQ